MGITKEVFRQSCVIAAIWLLCMVTKSYILFAVFGVGLFAALSRKVSLAWACWTILTMAVTLNHNIVPKAGMVIGVILRGGPLLIALATVLVAQSGSRDKLPIGMLTLYLIAQIVSSMNGLVPQVSFMKLFQFFAFFFGLWLGTGTLAGRAEDLHRMRVFFLSLILVLLGGSILAYPFPEISYSTTLREAVYEGAEYARYKYEVMLRSGGLMLFSGITDHSQTLAPFLSIMIIYVSADMIFVERKISALHIAMIVVMLVMLFMTRSRTGLFAVAVSGFIMVSYTFKKVNLPRELRQKLQSAMTFGGILLLLLMAAMEVRSQTFTKWLRKTNDVEADYRAMDEAITQTRQGTIDQCMYEFNQNRFMGIGFQVSEQVKDLYDRSSGLILSAPIEKGLLPLMVLGEGGIVGAILFYIFVIGFTSGCIKGKYFVSLLLFIDFFCTNIGEATFFSPGGPGGVMWAIFVLGGFSTDQMIKMSARRQTVYNGYYISY